MKKLVNTSRVGFADGEVWTTNLVCIWHVRTNYVIIQTMSYQLIPWLTAAVSLPVYVCVCVCVCVRVRASV